MRLSNLAAAAAPVIFVILWSTGFIGARYGLPYAEPFTFLTARMTLAALALGLLAIALRAPWLGMAQIGHSVVAGLLVQALYLGGVFTALAHGVPAGITALITGLQPIATSAIASRWLGEKITLTQWAGLLLGLLGVALVLHDRTMVASSPPIGWIGAVAALVGITTGTLYQKKYCSGIDLLAGTWVQFAAASVVFCVGAFAFETRVVRWSGEFIFALVWLVLVLSVVTIILMYWLIRRSAATGFSSLFYMVPAVTALMAYLLFGEKLDALSVAGMIVCAAGVILVNRGSAKPLPG